MAVDFFTDEELAAELKIPADSLDETYAARARAKGTATVQALVGHPIYQVVDDEVTLLAAGQRVLQLPHWPVTAVKSVTVDGHPMVAADFDFTRTGELLRTGARYGRSWGHGLVTVVYTHGYELIPDPVKEVAIELAAASYVDENPAGLVSETIGGYSVRYGTADPVDVYGPILDAYR